jgi:hypothetical protein
MRVIVCAARNLQRLSSVSGGEISFVSVELVDAVLFSYTVLDSSVTKKIPEAMMLNVNSCGLPNHTLISQSMAPSNRSRDVVNPGKGEVSMLGPAIVRNTSHLQL